MKKKWRRRWEAVVEKLTFVVAPPLVLLIRLIPLTWIYPLGRAVAALSRIGIGRRKKIALANLKLVFDGRKREEEMEAIYQECLVRTITGFLESLKFCFLPLRTAKERIEIIGKENLDRALYDEKGVIAISVHLGNFPLIAFRLGLEGYPVALIIKDPRNRYLARLYNRYKNRSGIELIDVGRARTATQHSLQQLRTGGIICLLLDQNPPYADIMVDFFGYPVPSYKGPVVLAMRTGASVLPMFMVSERDGEHKIVIEKSFSFTMSGDKEQDVAHNLGRLMKLIEGYIERYPEQWWWWHRRWKRHIDYKAL